MTYFEAQLHRAAQEGAFLALSVSLNDLQRAEAELMERFPLVRVNLDELFIGAMREQARQAGVAWQIVLRADAAPRESTDWRNLGILVERSLPAVEAQLSFSTETLLLTYPGLLARYGRMALLERLRDKIGGADSGLHGLWVLLPDCQQSVLPTLNGQAVPVIGAGQWARIPAAWLAHQHRAG